jgi:hypothetical protein
MACWARWLTVRHVLAGPSCAAFPDTFWVDGAYTYANTSLNSATECCALCIDDPQCVRYEFSLVGGSTTVCYVFHTPTTAEPSPAVNSIAGNGERVAPGYRRSPSLAGTLFSPNTAPATSPIDAPLFALQ